MEERIGVYDELMDIATVTEMLCKEISKNWENYTPQKQYAYGLLGIMLLDRGISNVEKFKGIVPKSKKSTLDRLKNINISLGNNLENIIFLLDTAKWPPGFENEWTETNNLELCRDAIGVSGSFAYIAMQTLLSQDIIKRKTPDLR